MYLIYLIHKFHNLSWITEINELFHHILVHWDAPVITSDSNKTFSWIHVCLNPECNCKNKKAQFLLGRFFISSWYLDPSLGPFLVKFTQILESIFLDNPHKAAVLSVGCASFSSTLFPSTQLSVNMLGYSIYIYTHTLCAVPVKTVPFCKHLHMHFTSLKIKKIKNIFIHTNILFLLPFSGVHTLLDDLLSPNVYFRFNPMLSSNVTLDESRPEVLHQLQKDTQLYLDRNRPKLERLCEVLMTERSAIWKTRDWIGGKAWELQQRWTWVDFTQCCQEFSWMYAIIWMRTIIQEHH